MMAIVAYASAHADPANNPTVDYTVDLSSVSLPQSSLQIYGAAADSANPGASFSWQWYILGKPSGSSVALSSATTQNPLVNVVDKWGNVRLFLVATNTSTAETSSTDPLRAPSSAFVVIRVLSEQQGIQKPAPGERNWFDDLAVWADKIEAMGSLVGSFIPHKIIDHSDVTDATGADLEALTGGGYADDPDTVSPNTANSFGHSLLHKHHGSDIDIATAAAPGAIYLDSAYSGSASTPRAMTTDYFLMTAYVTRTYADIGAVDAIFKGYTRSGVVQPMVLFAIPPDVGGTGLFTVEDVVLVFNQAPSDTTEYTFDLVDTVMDNTTAGRKAWNITAVSSSSWTLPALDGATDPRQTWGVSFKTEGNTAGFGPFPTTGRGPIGIRCTASPELVDKCGLGLSITLVCKRS
jgi:hypothetical protein